MSNWFNELQETMKKGRPEGFVALEPKILAVIGDEPDNADAWHALALIANATRRHAVAERRVNQAIRLSPANGEFINTRGAIRLAQNRARAAEKDFERAMAAAPQYPTAALNLGRLRLGAQDAPGAVAPLEAAARLQPRNLETAFLLATALLQSGRLSEAESRLQALLKFKPVQAEAEAELGHIQLLRGRLEEALAHFEKAWAGTTSLDNRLSLCRFFIIAGNIERGIEGYREILRQNPRHVRALSQLGHNLAADLPDEQGSLLEKIVRDSRQSASERSAAGYSLASVYGARKDHAKAGEFAALANAQQCLLQKYNPKAHRRMVDRIIAEYGAEYFRRTAGWGLPDRRPIFIVGMPRSGTTLVEQILAAHPDVFAGGELIFILNDMRTRSRVTGKDWTTLPPSFTPEDAAHSAKNFLDLIRERNADARHVTDKLPENYFYLGWIRTLFPNAAIIHCRRDDRDIALSCWLNSLYRLEWANNMEHISERLRDYHRLMRHWKETLPNPPLDVSYEQLVSDFEPQARRLVEHCGLEWDPACLEPHRVQRAVNTASIHQVRNPVHAGSVEKWRSYADHLQPLLTQAE